MHVQSIWLRASDHDVNNDDDDDDDDEAEGSWYPVLQSIYGASAYILAVAVLAISPADTDQ